MTPYKIKIILKALHHKQKSLKTTQRVILTYVGASQRRMHRNKLVTHHRLLSSTFVPLAAVSDLMYGLRRLRTVNRKMKVNRAKINELREDLHLMKQLSGE